MDPTASLDVSCLKDDGPRPRVEDPSASRARRGKGTAQISRICTSMAMADTGPACAELGGYLRTQR